MIACKDIDKLTLDIIAGSTYSLNFLRSISVAIFDPRIRDVTVREFHASWLEKAKHPEHAVPYCLGSIFGYLFCGILLSKERWYDLLPLDTVRDASPDWGFRNATFSSPKEPNPSVQYAVRRIRNALGHGNIGVNVPPDLDYRKDEYEFEKRTNVKFVDENPNDKSDLFEIEMPVDDLYMLVKKFHGIVFNKIIGDENI